MKKRIICMLLAFVCMVLPAAAVRAESSHDVRIHDDAGLLSESEYDNILSRLDEVSERQQFEIVIVTMESFGNYAVSEVADDFYDYHNYGYGSDRDGVLLLIGMETREWYISTSGFGIKAITDAGREYMSDCFVPYMSDGNYEKAFEVFIDKCDEFVTQAKSGEAYDTGNLSKEPFNVMKTLGIALVIGMVAAVTVAFVLAGQLQSVKARNEAAEYVVRDSMKVNESRDIFLYANVTKTAKPKDNSSGGSSTHTSSSGARHGGGGGHF